MFTEPPLARVGLSEREAQQQGVDVRIARLPMSGVRRTATTDETQGFMKALVGASDDRILTWKDLGRGRVAVWLPASLLPLLLAYTVATFPGEWLEEKVPTVRLFPTSLEAWQLLPNVEAVQKDGSGWATLHEILVAGRVDLVTRRPVSLWSNRLVLLDFAIGDRLKFDSEHKISISSETVSLRGRRLEGAVLAGAHLRKADFTGADLSAADLSDADLSGANLGSADLRGGANLSGANLSDADLSDADLEDAHLIDANLTGANLSQANLNGADLSEAYLRGADLSASYLLSRGEGIEHAQLDREAQLDRACGIDTKLDSGLTLKPCPK